MKGHRYWVAVVFFLLAAAPGFWFPALSNVLDEYGLSAWKLPAFVSIPLAGMISPMIFGAQIDRRLQAQKVLGWIMFGGASFLFLAYWAIDQGWGGHWFLFFFVINSLISAPAWSLLNTITLSCLDDPGKSFGYFRVWGTLGWAAAGLTVSAFAIDFSAQSGMLGAGVRIFAGAVCFLLPVTLPKGRKAASWGDQLGFGALKLLKDRDLFVYFLTALLFTIPLGAYYLHTPEHLRDLGVEKVSAVMTTGQFVETFAMLGMGFVIARFRIKTIYLVAIIFGVLRYGFYAANETGWLIAGIMLHGVCWTFFFETGRVFVHRRVEDGMRGQAQALLGFFTSGLGGALGIFVVGALHSAVVPSHGWPTYWMILTAFNFVALVIFTFGYRGVAAPAKEGG